MWSIESALVLARHILAEQHARADEAAQRALERVDRLQRVDPEALEGLLPGRYVALICAGDTGEESVQALRGPWSMQQASTLLRDILPSKRSGAAMPQMVTAPDSVSVVVGFAGPLALQEQDHYAMVVIPLEREQADAMARVEESMLRAHQLTRVEALYVRNIAIYFAGLSVVFVAFALSGGLYLARSLTGPIERLRQAFEAVATGELGIQVPGKPKGELGQLTDGFNRMSRDLQRSHHQLVRATRLAAWQDVARRLAHEIKNPLTPITLSIHRLRKRTAEDDRVVQECLDTILEETAHLQRLADEFSSFARMPKPKLESLDAAEILQQVLDLYAAVPHLHLRTVIEQPTRVQADRDQIRQVFTNLVKNAVEAMPEGGELEVSSLRENGLVSITFIDQGCGFPEAAGDRVFDPTFTTKTSGTGLGLAIVRRILEDHGGDIQMGNRDGGGAWVRIRLRAAT
jgi:nitrogen fixation/metabolism regulation signal transduction histidine kinase